MRPGEVSGGSHGVRKERFGGSLSKTPASVVHVADEVSRLTLVYLIDFAVLD